MQRSMNIRKAGVAASRTHHDPWQRNVSPETSPGVTPLLPPSPAFVRTAVIQAPNGRAGVDKNPSPCPGHSLCYGLECLQGQALQNMFCVQMLSFFCHYHFL